MPNYNQLWSTMMTFQLPDLPYSMNALEPHISQETLEYHYGKHHQAYVNKLNDLITDTKYATMSLEEIIQQSEGGIFNNAAQHFNHTFYWLCLTPNNSEQPQEKLSQAINEEFGSMEDFKNLFTQAALTQFGSGWAWLVQNDQGKLEIYSTSNAANPLTQNHKPLLTCDVWEHAYYIDTRNQRPLYLQNFWNIVNWNFVAERLAAHSTLEIA